MTDAAKIDTNLVTLARPVLFILLALAASCASLAQQPTPEQLTGPNAKMTALQPAWAGPMIQSNSRLCQGVRLPMSNSYAPGYIPPIVLPGLHRRC